MARAPPQKDSDLARTWRPNEWSRPTLEAVASLRLLLLLLAAGIAVRWAYLERTVRQQEGLLARQRVELALLNSRRNELERTIAHQHAELRQAESEQETLGLELEAIEMQLDGVDALSRRLREEMGLPASPGTWSGLPDGTAGTGSRREAATVDADRLALLRMRLSAGLAELYALQANVEARKAASAGLAERRTEVAREPANWPARGDVTSSFGWRIFRGVPNFHTGIDIALAYGTPVQATADGVVLGSGWQPGYGWCVLLQHDNGYNTLYAHLSALSVASGKAVRQGEVVGLSGSSGTSTGPHLHYEVWQNGQLLDPRPSMDGAADR